MDKEIKVKLVDSCCYAENGLLVETFLCEVQFDDGQIIKKEFLTKEAREGFIRGARNAL